MSLKSEKAQMTSSCRPSMSVKEMKQHLKECFLQTTEQCH